MSKAHREHWESAASRVARRVNLGWWLEALTAPLLVAALVGAAGLLLVRRSFPGLAPPVLWAAAGATLAVLALAAWLLARRNFETADQALVRLEAAMRLRNGLTTARAGVGPWPAPAGRMDAGLSWQWRRVVVPLAGALALLAAGLWLPVSQESAVAGAPVEQPQSWGQLATELDRFTEEELVDEKYLEETRRKLDELKEQAVEQWFSHASLEATDSLKATHQAESARVGQQLGKAEKALAGLQRAADGMAPAEQERLMEEFDQALAELQNGAMKPNQELLDQLRGLDPEALANLTPEQMEMLREKLKKNAEALKGAGGGEGDGGWSDELADGEDPADAPGQPGGVERGPGHVPGVLGDERDRLDIGELEGVEAADLSQTAPGDLLELQDGKHEVDLTPSGQTAGGEAAATGQGGDRVWKESLDPAEQRTLKRFFE